MNCDLLVLGGDGGVVNTLIPFFNSKTIIVGRKTPVVEGDYDFVCANIFDDVKSIVSQVQSVKIILNCIGYAGADVSQNGLNLTSLKSIVKLAAHYNCRVIHLSTIKCNHLEFIEHPQRKFRVPFSPYAWSKLAAELYLENHWGNSSILRMGFLNSKFCVQYYNHSRILSSQQVHIVTPQDLWQIITEESRFSVFRKVNAVSYRQALHAFARQLTGKRFVLPVNARLISLFTRLIPSKIFDYYD